jgi:hypothetical protein
MKKLAPTRRPCIAVLAALCTATLLAACDEIPQDARKPFAGESEVKLHSGASFDGDRQKFDQALTERADHSDDYRMVGGARP